MTCLLITMDIDDLGKIYAAMLTDNVNIDGEIAPLYDYYYYVSK